MTNIFVRALYHWKILLSDRTYLLSLLAGAVLLFVAYFVNQISSTYNDTQTYLSVGDLILDTMPVINLDFIYTWGMYAIIVLIVVYPFLFKPEIVPFGLKVFAILIFVRCGFVLLTNLGPPVGFFYAGGPIGGNAVSHFMFKNDLFFSGHTAYPFLAYLIFRNENKWVARTLLASSFLQAFTVLAMHIHYSIDVFAAFFIAYGVYKASDHIFNRLTLRFRDKIRLYGWVALEKLKNLRN